jgi:Ca-activated chloride channel family protein
MKQWRVALILTVIGLIGSVKATPKPTPHQAGLISTNTRLVRLLVVVFDDKGARATGLTQSDFRVLDNGVEQRISYFSDMREPVSVVLAADDSRSMTHKIPFEQEALDTLLDPYPGPGAQGRYTDEFALVRFASRAERATRFMTGEELEPWINRLVQPTDGNTALFDAIYLSTAVARQGANKRRAIILVTDGGDNNSRFNLRQTRRFLEETEVPVFAIMASPSLLSSLGIFAESPKEPSIPVPGTKHTVITPQDPIGRNNEDVIGPAERRGPHNMKVLTEASGGAVFTARRLSDLPRIVRTVGRAIRYAYLIGYIPPPHVENVSRSSSPGADGWHSVKVELVPASRYRGYMVYTKDGYYDAPIR